MVVAVEYISKEESAGVEAAKHGVTGILAVQGAFAEHAAMLDRLGAPWKLLRAAEDFDDSIDRVILPGGESTTQAKLLHELGLMDPLRKRIKEGMPVLATCAGLILLAETVDGTGDLDNLNPAAAQNRLQVKGLGTMPITVRRNAYGRQLGSFHAEGRWEEGAKGTEEAAGATCVADAKDYSSNSATLASEPVPLTFIRAPRIEATGPGVEPLVTLNDAPVAVRHRNQIAAAFHPELDDDNRLYEALLAPLKRAY